MTRYKHKDTKGVFAHPEQHPRGDYVLYTDHATQMREVLETLVRALAQQAMPDDFAQPILDKYRHYLDKEKNDD